MHDQNQDLFEQAKTLTFDVWWALYYVTNSIDKPTNKTPGGLTQNLNDLYSDHMKWLQNVNQQKSRAMM